MPRSHLTMVLCCLFLSNLSERVPFVRRATADEKPPLELAKKISLRGPAGRLDHLALDGNGSRLFVANMANSSLDVVDLKGGQLLRQIPDQKGIQGIAYAPESDRIFVGNGAGNSCNVFDGRDYSLLKSFTLPDTDNVRYAPRTQRVYAAHAEHSLTVIDAKSLEVLGTIKLPGAPEAFQLEKASPVMYLNTPSARSVVKIDMDRNEIARQFPIKRASANFPLAIDEAAHRLFIGCRKPPAIVVLDSESGKETTSVPIAEDIDDLFFDPNRHRLYASCGAGSIMVIRQGAPDRYEVVAEIPTKKGARTSLLDPDFKTLYLVAPRHDTETSDGPEIWVFRVND
jgi:DNA-binding beta-propeller fold protein YncE